MSEKSLSSHTIELAKRDQTSLSKNLKPRHISMIAVGGIIGAGLFVGSAHSIHNAGPSVLLAYGLAGLTVLFVCQIMGELATTWPGKGSFALFGNLAFGRTFGSIVGATYWWFWVLIIPVEAVAIGNLFDLYLPFKAWQITLAAIVILSIINLFSSGVYGETEFMLSSGKITAIICFIVIGLLAIFGLTPHPPHGISHLWSEGVFPHGISGTLSAFLVAATSYAGTESISLVSNESVDPVKNIKKSLRSIVWRIAIFYLGSLFVASSLISYKDIDLHSGTFASVLVAIGIPHAAVIVNTIILVALFSCLNSAIYLASRMLHGMGEAGAAPHWIARVSSKQVPTRAVLVSSGIGLLAVIGQYNFGQKMFGYLLDSSGASMLILYACMIATQLKLRTKAKRENMHSPILMWFHPWLSGVALITIIVAILWLLTMPEEGIPVLVSVFMTCFFAVVAYINKLKTAVPSPEKASITP